MTSRNNTPKRRLALKLLGGSALTGALADKLPAAWQRPVVDGGMLPARFWQIKVGQLGMDMVSLPHLL